MSKAARLLQAPGSRITVNELTVEKACKFARFLGEIGSDLVADFLEARRIADSEAQVVVFNVSVQRPQRCVWDVRKRETLAAIFGADDSTYPEVLALRSDFPAAPHINLRREEFPRSLCLYDQPYEQVRLNWTPANFLTRIQFWLSRTATGTLHGEDQPLEPLIQGSTCRVILPSRFRDFSAKGKGCLLDLVLVHRSGSEFTFRATERTAESTGAPKCIAAMFVCDPQPHGIMRHQPTHLRQLHDLCLPAGLDLGNQLREKIRDWYLNKPTPQALSEKLFLLLRLPKTRRPGGPTESVETWGFFSDKSVESVGISLGVIDKRGGQTGYVIGGNATAPTDVPEIPIGLLEVQYELSPAIAALMNGGTLVELKIAAIGMGALGSQIFNNLLRAGFGHWAVIDHDVLLPHNCARHFLGGWAVGQNKAEAMAAFANAVLDSRNICRAIPADVLKPADHRKALGDCLANAELILDFSASVAVCRSLAKRSNKARHATAFLSPDGKSLIVGVEDASRKVRLDWFEMLHYRAVLNEVELSSTLASQDSRVRYGNACRDLTSEIAQTDVATWAALASKAIASTMESDKSALTVFVQDKTTIRTLQIDVTNVISVEFREWTFRFDEWLLEKLREHRRVKLPNETGGILLGCFDTYHKICSIIDMVPSPPDSTEWPTSYIRGCKGLRERVLAVENQTLGQISYVGEWHSHPEGSSVLPSAADLEAYSWLVGHMHPEGYPAIMLIIGDAGFTFVSLSEKDKTASAPPKLKTDRARKQTRICRGK